jgi:hypothetical protein
MKAQVPKSAAFIFAGFGNSQLPFDKRALTRLSDQEGGGLRRSCRFVRRRTFLSSRARFKHSSCFPV